MTLDAYLRKHGLTSAQFAKATGALTKQTVHNYRHGIRFPSAESMRLIDEQTGGEVTPKDFVEQHAGASQPPGAPANDTPKPKSKRPTRSAGATAPPTSSSAVNKAA
jgi:transcriptional regulator with XRE-family HTH domain